MLFKVISLFWGVRSSASMEDRTTPRRFATAPRGTSVLPGPVGKPTYISQFKTANLSFFAVNYKKNGTTHQYCRYGNDFVNL